MSDVRGRLRPPDFRWLYELCSECDHFVDDTANADEAPNWQHLDDGEGDHDHGAKPSGVRATLSGWRCARPDLFINYDDEKIGPNSAYHLSARY